MFHLFKKFFWNDLKAHDCPSCTNSNQTLIHSCSSNFCVAIRLVEKKKDSNLLKEISRDCKACKHDFASKLN